MITNNSIIVTKSTWDKDLIIVDWLCKCYSTCIIITGSCAYLQKSCQKRGNSFEVALTESTRPTYPFPGGALQFPLINFSLPFLYSKVYQRKVKEL